MLPSFAPIIHFSMRRKALLALAAVAVVALVCVGAFLVRSSASKPSPRVTVRLIQSIQGSDGLILQFEITNHTAKQCLLSPFRQLEVCRDSEWKPCFEDHFRSSTIMLHAHEVERFGCVATEMPMGLP